MPVRMGVLWGLVRPPSGQDLSNEPGAKIMGTFQSAEVADEYVQAGGLPAEFPMYGITEEEGAFWVVGSSVGPPDGWHDPLYRPTILAGPFDTPYDACAAEAVVDPTGWAYVGTMCAHSRWSDAAPRAEAKYVRPRLDWAEQKLPGWEKAGSPREVGIAFAETAAFMSAVREWLEGGAVGGDAEYGERLLGVGIRIAAAHRRLHGMARDLRQGDRGSTR